MSSHPNEIEGLKLREKEKIENRDRNPCHTVQLPANKKFKRLSFVDYNKMFMQSKEFLSFMVILLFFHVDNINLFSILSMSSISSSAPYYHF